MTTHAFPEEAPLGGPIPLSEKLYVLCASMFTVVLVLTNIVGVKLFVLFPDGGPSWILDGGSWTLTTGIITYPLTFLLTDVVSEIWGKRRADYMVILGFVMSLLMLGVVTIARALPPSSFWTNDALGLVSSDEMQQAFDASFYYPGVLLGASMTAYLVAQLFDVRLYHFWRRVTQGRHLWLRNNGSTWISQLVDTIIVNSIFLRWGLKMEWQPVFQIIVAVYVCKMVLAVLDTPLIYLCVHLLRRTLRLDEAS